MEWYTGRDVSEGVSGSMCRVFQEEEAAVETVGMLYREDLDG